MNAKIKQEIEKIAVTTRLKYRKVKWFKVTQKSMREIESLGLAQYITRAIMAQEIIDEVIRQAKNTGGKYVTEGGWTPEGEGYSDSYITEPSPLYLALHEPTFDLVTFLRNFNWTSK